MTLIRYSDGTQILLPDTGSITIELPNLTGVHIDHARRIIAVDGLSGSTDAPIFPDYSLHDLRDGSQGDFHQLAEPGGCGDPDCKHVDTLTPVS